MDKTSFSAVEKSAEQVVVSAIEFQGEKVKVTAIYPDGIGSSVVTERRTFFLRVTCKLEWPLHQIGKTKTHIG